MKSRREPASLPVSARSKYLTCNAGIAYDKLIEGTSDRLAAWIMHVGGAYMFLTSLTSPDMCGGGRRSEPVRIMGSTPRKKKIPET